MEFQSDFVASLIVNGLQRPITRETESASSRKQTAVKGAALCAGRQSIQPRIGRSYLTKLNLAKNTRIVDQSTVLRTSWALAPQRR